MLNLQPRRSHSLDRVCDRQDLSLRSLSLFCAEAGARGAAWAANQPADLPRARLLDAGYCCVAQEGRIGIAIAPPAGEGGASWCGEGLGSCIGLATSCSSMVASTLLLAGTLLWH